MTHPAEDIYCARCEKMHDPYLVCKKKRGNFKMKKWSYLFCGVIFLFTADLVGDIKPGFIFAAAICAFRASQLFAEDFFGKD